jgi:hypothetical protein
MPARAHSDRSAASTSFAANDGTVGAAGGWMGRTLARGGVVESRGVEAQLMRTIGSRTARALIFRIMDQDRGRYRSAFTHLYPRDATRCECAARRRHPRAHQTLEARRRQRRLPFRGLRVASRCHLGRAPRGRSGIFTSIAPSESAPSGRARAGRVPLLAKPANLALRREALGRREPRHGGSAARTERPWGVLRERLAPSRTRSRVALLSFGTSAEAEE